MITAGCPASPSRDRPGPPFSPGSAKAGAGLSSIAEGSTCGSYPGRNAAAKYSASTRNATIGSRKTNRRILYSPAGTGRAPRAARAAMPTRQRRSLRLTMPPNAITKPPAQIHDTSGFQ